MKHIRLLTFLFLPFFLFSQETEKRLALVIGNSNYDKGELKNPVNDARLIASTLDSLDFEVLLHENLETRRDMTAAIRDFGVKLPENDVSFIYYAGHGIQINSENFLLPTKEIFELEIDVEDYGVSVQRILKYIETNDKEKINILVIDACRDNPFESSWNSTRSLKSGGLAKINPPTGSIIAFSTDSGNTAPDGDNQNSIYTESLSKNLLKPDTSIEQIFKYVRKEVLEQTKGIQKPIENNTLIGDPYIFNKSNYFKSLNELDKIIKTMERPYKSMYNTIDHNELLKLSDKIEEYTNQNSIAITAKLLYSDDLEKFLEIYSKIDHRNHDTMFSNFFKYLKASSIYWSDIDENCFYENEETCIKLLNEASDIFNELEQISLNDIYWFENRTEFDRIYHINHRHDVISNSLALRYNQGISRAIQRLEKSIDYYNKFYENNISLFKDDPENELFAERFMKVTPRSVLLKLKEVSDYDKNILAQEWRDLYKEFPNDINLLSGRISKIMSLYEYELARTLINRSIANDPDDPGMYFLLYLIDKSNKDYLSAILNLRYAIERNKDGYYIPREYLNLNSDYLLTIGTSVMVAETSPISNFELRIFLGELYNLVGNKTQMCQEYENLLSISKDDESIGVVNDLIFKNCSSNN